MAVAHLVTVALSIALIAGNVTAAIPNLGDDNKESVNIFGRTPILISDEISTSRSNAAVGDVSGTLFYITDLASDFNIYSLDLLNLGQPSIVAQSPSYPTSLAVHDGNLYWTTGPNLYSCVLGSDSACETSSPPVLVHTFENNVGALSISTSTGNFYVGETKTQDLHRGEVQSDGTISFSVLTTLDQMWSITTTNSTVLACCKMTDSEDIGTIVQVPEMAKAPVPSSQQTIMWESQNAWSLEAIDDGLVYWTAGGNQHFQMRFSHLWNPHQFTEVTQPQWAQYTQLSSVCASGPFWSSPLVATSFGHLYHCSRPACGQYDDLTSSITGAHPAHMVAV
eukprot:GFYU01008816.1.p1 GENE.GFYU01008816.1~~GFYU01008816.1.p1  ORF type:complete len:375 (+),score=50.11 GFYU01008816.1:116-1126(+)